ncbi:recombinase family protein [Pseudophaeobacter sp. TrK17]|uniref:recombinase family protein n=1 Tax=Pseudophaeobacter sp. TrK17 TaxID=2815167 RepID=UPI0035CEECC8
MIVGYARTSTLDQTAGLEAQQRDLAAAGCEKVFVEQVSSVDVVAREQLAQALDYIREGDALVVTKLDRLARSVAHLVELLAEVEKKGASLRILDMGIDTSTTNGRLMLNVLGSIAQFEREIMLERQREGIAKAKAAGKYKGRKPTAKAKAKEVLELHAEGVGGTEIAKRLGIGRASVYRILKEEAA